MYFKINVIYFFAVCIYIANTNKEDNKDDRNFETDPAPDENVIHPPKSDEGLRPPCCGVTVPACDPNAVFRRYDGSCNNLKHPTWGLPNSTYTRLFPARYNDGKKSPRRAVDSSPLPGARRLRTTLFPIGNVANRLWDISIMIWGQFMAHDMSLLKQPDDEVTCCPFSGKFTGNPSKFCFPIKIPEDDPTQGAAGIKCMNFTRTVTDHNMGCGQNNQSANQINVVTPYLDLSNVYGNDEFTANSLRSSVGGRMKVEERNNRIYAPTEPNKEAFCKCNLANENTCYATGDSRSNQNPHLAILQIMFVREHNRLAAALANLNPHWDDERLFQEARRINIAQYQRISYYEWMPILLNAINLIKAGVIFFTPGFVNDYDPSVSPDIISEHAHGAYRHFHTQIVGMLSLMNEQRSVLSTVAMNEWMNRPDILERGTFMEQFTVNMVTQKTGETDVLHDEQISDRLFSCQNLGFGIDLKATDIQRDRDHALGYYNDYRRLFGLKVATSFDDYRDLISPENVEKLKTLYKSHEDVDLSVGGSLEHVCMFGPQVGPTFLKILLEQFKRIRQSDRFWFEHVQSGFTLGQLFEIRKASFSRLYCDNGDGIDRIQGSGFTIPFFTSFLAPCTVFPSIDLRKWQEVII